MSLKQKSIKLDQAIKLATSFCSLIEYETHIVGSIRREEEYVNDIDIIIVCDDISFVNKLSCFKYVNGKDKRIIGTYGITNFPVNNF